MKYLYLTLTLIVGLWLGTSCSSDLPEEELTGSIAGSVADATTGEPVATVKVTLTPGGNSTVTGSDGTFTFRNLDAAKYTLAISKEGYKPNSATVNVKPGEPTPAHLLIERIPTLVTADRSTLDFGDNQSLNTLSFNIVNSGYENLDWEIEERCDWITEVKPSKGTLAHGKTEGIVVVINRDSLNTGENKAVIVIRSTRGSSEMNVTAVGPERSLASLNALPVTDITASAATLNGEITDPGHPAYTSRGFVIATTPMPTLETTISKITVPVNDDAAFEYKLSGLTYNETYYVRSYAVNAIGTAYSANEVKFTTVATMPEVNTLEISSVDFSGGTATFRGSVTAVGNPAYTERGFVYSTAPEPTIYDLKVVASGSGVVSSFSKYVTNLPKSKYYVRAYATSQAGTAYGEEKEVGPEWIELPEAGIAVQCKDLGTGDWSTANELCKSSKVGGFTDWRLPTKSELMVLYNNRDKIGGFNTTSSNSYYWSGTLFPSYNTSYYAIRFYNGYLDFFGTSNQINVRAVRTLK